VLAVRSGFVGGAHFTVHLCRMRRDDAWRPCATDMANNAKSERKGNSRRLEVIASAESINEWHVTFRESAMREVEVATGLVL
jgi:hypothetical protein